MTLTATADARADTAASHTAPLAARLREARDSLHRVRPYDTSATGPTDPKADSKEAARDGQPGAVRWVNYWGNVVVPWRNWNNWNNWHNFNQWVNL